MKIIPLFKVRDMRKSIAHYTELLDFKLTDSDDSADSFVVDVAKGEAGLQLTILESDQLLGSVANLIVDDVGSLFASDKSRGLDTAGKKDSPVHQGPIDQTWGRREFYITDPDGNTLRFCQQQIFLP